MADTRGAAPAKALEPQGFTITPDQLTNRVSHFAHLAIQSQEELAHLNLLGGIEWGQRERLRTIQGHFDKIEDVCIDLIWSDGSEHAANVAEAIWGPIETD